ncbi:putative phospholipase C [Corchorus capsularis]|uniref:Putative phospholipase C n=1 Tax=Corchorus capsularis TaxID=210143 RepID=A0A1R3GQ18_COCAP|nr:putative phospholipase C [Corchorus capsularis]
MEGMVPQEPSGWMGGDIRRRSDVGHSAWRGPSSPGLRSRSVPFSLHPFSRCQHLAIFTFLAFKSAASASAAMSIT